MAFCRATAALLIASTITLPITAQTSGLTCSSDDGDYHYCRADTKNKVELLHQLSRARCERDYSWGFDPLGIWVDRGCRAQFNYGRPRTHGHDDDDKAGTLVAAGVLGALIVGAAAASAASSSSGDHDAFGHHDDTFGDHDLFSDHVSGHERVNYYNDGYRMGRQDADNSRPNFHEWWSERYPMKYERDFAAGYTDGYNNNGRRPPR